MDETVTGQLADSNVAGAVVAVIQDGELVFAKGYGHADIEAGTAVDPERTLFRIGSATKLFTATAVMQLVEDGRLDLDEDVNNYLDFTMPGTEPITLTNLLTHTPGFEDAFIGYQQTPDEAPSREEWIAGYVPARVRVPGRYSAYSNYGMALAGYIVERVSGMTYEDYVEANILAPLGMTRSTPRWPVPDALAADLSLGYRDMGGDLIAADYQPITPALAPTGLASATAGDMARFMIAHLEGGALGDARILDADTTQLMHSRIFGHDDRVNGFAYGFYEMSRDGVRIIGHGGDTQFFHSLVALFPEEGLGLFVSYNSETAFDGVSAIYEDLLAGFVDRFFPAAPPEPSTGPGSAQRAAGSYLTLRSNQSSVFKAIGLVSTVLVTAVDERTIDVVTPTDTFRFTEIGPLEYGTEDGETLVFEDDLGGNVTHAFLNGDPTQAFEKLPWYRSPRLHLPVLLLGMLALVTVPLVAGIGWVTTRLRKQSPSASPEARRARWILTANGLLALLLVAVYAAVDLDALMAGRTTTLTLVPVVTLFMAFLTVATGVFAILAWRRRFWRLPARLHYTAVTLTAAVFLWSAYSWNLTGW